VAQEKTGGIGKAIVWQPSNSSTFQKYGHVWIIIGQNPDGSWKVKSSNIKWDGAISIDNVPASVALWYKTLPWVSVQASAGEDIKMQALSLVQWLGWTADERQAFADNVIKVAQRDNISLAEAKKKLGYKSADDTEFAKTRKEDIQSLKKDTRDKLSNANTALTLLNQPQTAIWDVASVVGFLKTIDPASVARESEVASVENARGILDSLSNVFAKAKEGTKLTDTQRTQLKQAIGTIVDAGNNKYYEAIYNTSQEFNDRGLDPTVYISKNDVTKANELFSGNAEVKKNPVQMTKEKAIDLYNKWKSNQK
jgi:hypothetical protein